MSSPVAGAPRWLKSAAKTIRNSPRLTTATTRVFGTIQGNRTLVEVATRVFAFDGAVPIVFLNAGRPLADLPDTERLPIIIVNAVGTPVAELPALVDSLVALQTQTRGFRPVVLLDVPEFRLLREVGYPMELVVAESDWSFDTPWGDYVADRLAMMLARYRAWTIVRVVDGALEPDGQRLLARLEHYRPWEDRQI